MTFLPTKHDLLRLRHNEIYLDLGPCFPSSIALNIGLPNRDHTIGSANDTEPAPVLSEISAATFGDSCPIFALTFRVGRASKCHLCCYMCCRYCYYHCQRR